MTTADKQPPRAATRSTRANQERKELLEAAQVQAQAHAASDQNHDKKSDAPGKETVSVTPTDTTGSEETHSTTGSGDQTSSTAATTTTRRSGRRAAVDKAGNTEHLATTAPETTAESVGAKPVDVLAVAACVAGGASLSVTATRFGISRADVTKIIKETTIPSVASDTAPPATEETTTTATTITATAKEGVASDASTETASDSDGVASRRTKRGTSSEEDVVATSDIDIVMTTAPADVIVPISSVPAAVTTPTGISNDLKRSADVLTDVSSDAATPVASTGNGSGVPKAKRVRKTREEKLSILAFVDDGGTHVAAAEKFGVSRTAVTKMVKERDIIMSGLSGKQHAAASAVNGSQQSMVAALVGSHPQIPTPLENAGPTPPPARKTRTSNTSARSQQQQTGAGGDSANPKAKRVRKTNEEKLLILEFVERGGSQGAAAEKFGVSRTAVTKMVKEREAITAQVLSGKSNHRKVLQYQHKLSIIEDMLYKWQVQVENDAPNLKITGDLLQSKAVEFRDKILAEWKESLEPEVVQSLSDFKASNGWLHRYLQRRNLRTATKREYHRRASPNSNGNASGAVPASPSDPFNMNLLLADLSQRLRTVPVQCIWNMDEIALLPKSCVASPSTTKEGDAAQADTEGDGITSDRTTIVLMVNAAGEKFKPEVLIAESSVEKQLDELQKAFPSLILTSQPNAWQDTTALALYLHAVSGEAKQRQETWFIVMDASASHMEFAQLVDPAGSFEQGYRFENLVLMFLPLQATTEQQPLHHGIARVFKAAYRHVMLAALVQKWQDTEDPKTSFDVSTLIDASDQMAWLASAWEAVPAALIRHCWVRNGLLSPGQLAQISQDNSRAIEAELFRSLTDTMALVIEQDDGALAQHLGIVAINSASGEEAEATALSLLDRVNALITLDDNEPTERKLEMPSANNHVITETDANGDLRALV